MKYACLEYQNNIETTALPRYREREREGNDNAFEFDFGKKQISLFHLAFLFSFKVLKLRDLSDLYQMSNTHFFSLYKGAWVGRKSE